MQFLLQNTDPQLGQFSTHWGDYFKLLIFLGVIFVAAWYFTRHVLPRLLGMPQQSFGPLQVVARFVLEPRRTLYIVKLGGQYLLLSSAENGIQFLTELHDAELATILQQAPAAVPAPLSLNQWLKKLRPETPPETK